MGMNDIMFLKQELPKHHVVVEGWSRSKAYATKRALDKHFNPHDKFIELKYDKEKQIARFELVS